ncbi:hypothetical protein BCR34DRAFT_585744 [Clohesyomyces aquaticus]|uniref:Uncharacterized protein n=1 Tax=Clohesyomyces aquaticus TaxID=1231657 RepID=A0A1Y1ZWH8_9PLEO|nr:hypothetical protein BCR34DRAFT_585744 [Clohesyomyces aquaticus]
MPTVIPPADKLPLIARKNLRDTWEPKKPELEAELSQVMGVPWKLDINPNAIWVYAQADSWESKNIGTRIISYLESAILSIKTWFEPGNHGDGGREEMNKVCSKHALTIAMDESGKIRTCGCDVKDGVLRILFNEKYLGMDHYSALSDLERALSDAADTSLPLSYAARISIQKYWETSETDIEARISKALQNPAIKLTPNFEEVYAALKAEPAVTKNDGWDANIGGAMREYFERFAWHLEDKKFGEDEMLREGFEEVVPEGEIKFRIVKELAPGGHICQSVIEDGILYMQSTAKYFGYDSSNVGTNIIDLL